MTRTQPTIAPPAAAAPSRGRFGTFGGVFTPSILTILGVIMYLRFGWVVGNAGLAGALLIVGLAHLITIATGLSVSSIATNRRVGVGGAYFMISRSLGAPVGAAIGIPLFFAQALSVTFYVVGFTESIRYLVPEFDPRLIGTATCVLLTLLSFKSADLAIKAQYVVMAAIGLSLLSFGLGRGPEPPTEITWWNPDGEPFDKVFAIFFPAVTGIMAGVSMSGDLREPRRSLPRGTMFAIFTGMAIYLVFPVWLALNAGTETLVRDHDIVWQIARFPSLIYLGVWGATLSSALGSILGAPRTLQALAADGLAPRLFARGHGPDNEPRLGLLFTFALAEVGILLGSLDVVAEVLTMFFLATYGMLNLACGLERWAASPSFRPTFAVPALVSIGGAVACFYVMSIIDMVSMVVAMLICGLIYLWTQRRVLGTTYGDARHGMWAAVVRTALHHLRRTEYHPMNWRPNLVILGGDPAKRRYLLDVGSALVQDRGIVTYFHLLRGSVQERAAERRELMGHLDERLADRHPNVFVRVDIAHDVYRGAVSAVQSYGIGTFEANAVMLGWPRNRDRADAYLAMLRDLSELDRSLFLVRYDDERGFGRRRTIHVWWGGMQTNGALMLLLSQLLTSHDAWREARVVALTVVDNEEARRRAEERLRVIFESARTRSEPRVLLRDRERPIHEIIWEESAGADLVMIGFRLPRPDEPAEAFFEWYDRLMERLPTTMLVHGARGFQSAPVLFDE